MYSSPYLGDMIAIKCDNMVETKGKHCKNNAFTLPPHINAETHKLVMARVNTMSDEEFIDSLVQAGICSPDGKLTDNYRDSSTKGEK